MMTTHRHPATKQPRPEDSTSIVFVYWAVGRGGSASVCRLDRPSHCFLSHSEKNRQAGWDHGDSRGLFEMPCRRKQCCRRQIECHALINSERPWVMIQINTSVTCRNSATFVTC